MQPTLLILAAGMGSRYGGLKQIDPLGPSGETIIDYSVYDAIQAGFGKVVFVIRESIEADFKEAFGNKFAEQIEVAYVHQELDKIPQGIPTHPERSKPWGTGHAVMVAHEAIDTPFAMINADDFYGREAFQVLGDFLRSVDASQPEFAMVGYQLANTLSDFGSVSRGVCATDQAGFLQTIDERTKIAREGEAIYYEEAGEKITVPGDSLVSMNIWGFTPKLFSTLSAYFEAFLRQKGQELKSEFYIPEVVGQMIREEKAHVKMLQSDARWFGVTYRDDRPIVVENLKQLYESGKYPSPLW